MIKINHRSSAFTLLEILLIVSILGILSSIIAIAIPSWQRQLNINTIKSDASNIASAMENSRNFSSTGYPANITSIYKSSKNITISGGSSDGGKTYCVDIYNSQQPDAKYYVSSETGNSGAVSGTCASRSNLASASNLTATTNSTSSLSISFTTVSGATSYIIQQATNASFTDSQTIATLNSSPSLPYIANSLQENKKYYYRVQAKNASYTSPWSSIASATTASSTIAVPSTPTVTQNTVGNNTTYSWNTVSCASGYTTAYQYQYVITPAGYDSGWRTIKTNNTTLTFTTSTEEQTYTIAIRANCSNNDKVSNYSTNSTVAYTRPRSPKPPTLASCNATDITSFSATLCANITSPGDTPITDSGICWSTSPNPTVGGVGSNCAGFYGGALSEQKSYPSNAINAIAISPDGRSVYVASTARQMNGGATLGYFSLYERNVVSGELTWKETYSGDYSIAILNIKISDDGRTVITDNSYYDRNPQTGSLIYRSQNKNTTLNNLKISSDGLFAYGGYATGKTLFETGSNFNGVLTVYNRNSTTGVLSALESYGIATKGLDIHPNSSVLFGAHETSVRNFETGSNYYGGLSSYDRNKITGKLSNFKYIWSQTAVCAVAVSPDGRSVYVGTKSSHRRYETATVFYGSIKSFNSPRILAKGAYSQIYKNMPSKTKIYYRGYATNSNGIGYSPDNTFVTK